MPNCTSCGKKIEPGNINCPQCGKKHKLSKRPKLILIAVVISLIAGISILYFYSFHQRQIIVPVKYPTIQAAIDSSKNGTTIIIEPGTYYENIDFKGKNIVLQSKDPDDPKIVASTIIDGGGNGSVIIFANGENSDAVLSGLSIINGSGTYKEFDYLLDGQQNNMEGCFGGGILIMNNSSPTLTKNIIINNKCSLLGRGGGIAIWNASATILENRIENNEADLGGGIFIGGDSFADLSNNQISENVALNGGGVYIGINSTAIINENLINKNRVLKLF